MLSVKVPEPKFSSQTKDKLVSSEVLPVVQEVVAEKLGDFLLEYPNDAKIVTTKIVDAARARLQRPLPDQRRRDGFREIAGNQFRLAHNEIGDAVFGFGLNLGALEQWHDDRGVHVEGERRRRAALPQSLIGDRVIEKARTTTAPLLPDRQREKALVAQLLVILNRVARIAVMRRSAFGKIRRQFQAFLLQPLLLRRQLKIHASGA